MRMALARLPTSFNAARGAHGWQFSRRGRLMPERVLRDLAVISFCRGWGCDAGIRVSTRQPYGSRFGHCGDPYSLKLPRSPFASGSARSVIAKKEQRLRPRSTLEL